VNHFPHRQTKTNNRSNIEFFSSSLS